MFDGSETATAAAPAPLAPRRPGPPIDNAESQPDVGDTSSSVAGLVSWRWVPYALAAAFLVVYLVLALARWHRMASPSWDLSIFVQTLRGYASFDAPIVDIKGPGFHQLGDHFSPLLAGLAPFYRAFPSPVTLLVAQAVLLALSIVPISRIGIRLLGLGTGVAIGGSYGLAWGIQSALDVEFHEYALAVPILAFALEALLRERWRAAALWTVALLLVKEDLGLTVAAMGACLAIRGQRRYGAVTAVIGVVGFVLIMWVAIPSFNTKGTYAYWGNLGEDGSTAADNIAGQLLISLPLHLVSPPIKLETVFLLGAVTGFIALRSPIMLLTGPTIAWRFISSNDGYWGPTWHYSLILMPIVFAAAVDGISRSRTSPANWLRDYARMVPAVMVTAAVLLCWKFPFKDLVQPQTYQPSSRESAALDVLDRIPDGSSVQSDTGLMSRLVSRTTVFWVGSAPGVRPDFVLIDTSAGWSPEPPADVATYAEQLHPGTDYETVFDRDGYRLAARTDS